MLGWLLWCCLVVSMYRQRVPSPRDHHSTSWGHESCRRHNIDMSFPHHFLPPPMLLQDTLKQWWLPMIGLRITPWPDCILNYTDHWSEINFCFAEFCYFWTPCTILKPILTVLLDLIIAHTCLSLAPAALTDSNSGWILKTDVGDDCILQWNWSVLLSAMEN